MDSSYWLVSVGSIGILAASIAIQIRTYSRRRPVRPIVIALGQAVAFGSMVIFSICLGRPPGVVEWVLILSVGVACGTVYGGLVRVEQTPAGIVMAYTLPWLVVWGALLLVTQGAAAITGRLPWVVYSLAIFTMTLNLGMNGRVIARYRALRIGGVVAAALVAPFLVGLLTLAPAGAQPARAANEIQCSVDVIPDLFRGLLPPSGINGDLSFQSTVLDGRSIVLIQYSGQADLTEEDKYVVWLYRSAGDANAARASEIAGYLQRPDETWLPVGDQGALRHYWETTLGSTGEQYGYYDYAGISGAAAVQLQHSVASAIDAVRRSSFVDDRFLSFMAAAGALDPAAVFALAATGSCDGVATGTQKPGSAGSTSPGASPPPGGTTGQPGGTSGGLSGIGDLLNGEPIRPGDLTQGLVLANGLLLLGSLGQLVSSGGLTGGAASTPGGSPSTPGGPPANGTPVGDGRIWYRVPGDDGGPVPMTPAEVAFIESKLRQGLIYSRTDGWVTPKQNAQYQAMRAHQLAVERAESARAAAESHRAIQAARNAQAAARQEMRNLDRRAEIYTEMRKAESQHAQDMAALAKAERVAWVGNALETAGDYAATGLGIVGGPLGIAVRAGYRVLKGTASGLGTGIADGASYGETTKRMYIGTVEGGVAAGIEMAVDGGVRKVFGMPPMFPEAPPPIPPSLLAPRAVVRQVLGDAADLAEKKGVDAAVRTVDPAKVMRLYRNGGMETLGQLEQAGAISASEAQVIRKVVSNEVNGSVAAGARDAAREFAKKTGVRLQEVLIGDSGSSAAGKVGSLVTDADRTIVGVFHPEDVAAYAKQHGISQAEAASALNRELTSAVDEKVTEQLGNLGLKPGEQLGQGLTPKDVGYTSYSGFGAKAGPGDSYAAGYTRARQAVQGDTLVVRPDGTTYRAGKDAILDAEGLAASATGTPMPPAQPTVPFSEFTQLGGKQVESLVAHTDPKSVAKAVDRVTYLAGRTGIPVDSTVAEAAKAIRAQPQSVGAILESYGLTPDEFRTRALDTSTRFMTKLERFMTDLKSPGQ